MKNRINEIKKKKHLKEWNKQYLDDTEEQISELEETAVEITEAKQKKRVRTSLAVQWLRIRLPMQGTQVHHPCSRKIPHDVEQLSPCTSTTEPTL